MISEITLGDPTEPGRPIDRVIHALTAPLHTYVIPCSPKMLQETLNVVEHAMHELEKARPGYNAGGTIASHLERLHYLADECSRKRPVGSDGKHGNLHTDECGCER